MLIFFDNINLFHFCMTSKDPAMMKHGQLRTFKDFYGRLGTIIDNFIKVFTKDRDCLIILHDLKRSCHDETGVANAFFL